ncbi:hypothetical protein, partial [Neisseria sp. HMSC075C12]|uniref:hypothetical protein n=2 Tax=unclassified Neisseria TaxID=2623750 RepID=UPI000B017122
SATITKVSIMLNLNINEEYLAKRKYNQLDEYYGMSMAYIYCDLIAQNSRVAGSDFYALSRNFSHRFLGAYLEIRFPDYSIAVYKIGSGNGVLLSKVFNADIECFNNMFE